MARLKIFRDRQRQYRWALVALNGRKVACSGEGYQRRRDCRAMAIRLFPWLQWS